MDIISKKIEGLLIPFIAALSPSGESLSLLDVDLISQLCFHSGNGVYHGTDSNPPSAFKRKYPQYLTYHEDNIKRKNKHGIRILIIEQRELEADYHHHTYDFQVFRNWHLANNIELFQVNPAKARELAESYQIPSTDIGIWDQEITAIFCEIANETEKLRLLLRPSGTDLFRLCQEYFIELIHNSNDIKLVANRMTFPERDLHSREEDMAEVRRQWKN